jgi:hypothetical protein
MIVRLAILSACLLCSFAAMAGESPPPLRASLTVPYRQATESFGKQTTALAQQCRHENQDALAQRIEHFLPESTSDSLFFFKPSDDYLTQPQSRAEKKFRKLRREHAQVLVQLAHATARAGEVGRAIALLYEALYCDGDLAEGREILGQKKISGRWVSSKAADRLLRGQKWSEQFGWLPEKHLDRYQQGERFFRGKWISALEDARQHKEMRNGWKIETDHYQVTTNLGLEAGVELAQKLEAFYTVWSQIFAAYYFSGESVAENFKKSMLAEKETRKHKVNYFRNRDEYDQALARIQPGIRGKTLGVYLEKIKTAYFFAPATESEEENELSQITIWHEAAHQLFAERIPTRKVSGLKNNFWFVEGIACFMETLQKEKQGWRLGGTLAGRLPVARIRLQRDHFYIPFTDMVTYGADAMLRNPQYRTLYTQAAGQAAFLMTAQDGKFRPAAIDYLRIIYRGRGKLDTLSSVTGKSLTALDQAYRTFLLNPSEQ